MALSRVRSRRPEGIGAEPEGKRMSPRAADMWPAWTQSSALITTRRRDCRERFGQLRSAARELMV
ncbi:hypothetical protein LAUMK35_05805 [Mycobacterium pseudokansasii]|nr:hypothetical protein LAUMK35_05805 [Mycobacterium pseudokansasii]VBA36129.1 hypothetical protein LAUMK21_05784 [Mycobacterium pseudokansasii]